MLLAPSGCGSAPQSSEASLYTQQLRDKNAATRRIAAANLGKTEPSARDSVPELVEALKDEDALVRFSAVSALGKVQAKPEITVPALVGVLRGKDDGLRREAAIALSQIGSPAVPALTEALKDRNAEVRLNAALALGLIGSTAKAAVPALIQVSQESNLAVQQQVIEALGQIGVDAQTAVPIMVQALQHPNWQIRASSAHALGEIGKSANSAIPALIMALNDRDAVVRQRTTFALSKVGSAAIPNLLKTLNDKSQDVKVRSESAYALGEMGAIAKISIPNLIESFQDDNKPVREGAIFALSQMGLSSAPALTASLKSNDERVRNSAAATLGKISGEIQDQVNPDPIGNGINFDSRLSLSEMNQALDALTQARSIMEASDPLNPLAGGRSRFPAEMMTPIRRTIDTIQAQKSALFLGIAVQILLIGLALLVVGAFVLFWLRPVVLLRFSRAIVTARQERDVFNQWLLIAKQFLEQAGATAKQDGKRSLRVISAVGRLKALAPFPVLLAIDTPTAQDVTELMQAGEKMGGGLQKQAGVLLYQEAPDTLFRVRMAEVRLRDQFVLIPIPLAAVEKAVTDPAACAGLLAQYADRYLPGADLFDDRNAIGDTLSFFGRTDLLHRLEEELLRKQGVGLFGLRKSGKTSILLQLGFSLRQHPVVHLDLQPYGGKPRYGAELFNEILRQLSLLLRERDKTTTLNLEPFSLEMPATALTTEFIQRIGKMIQALTQVGYEPPLLLFLDEIERILPTPTDPTAKVEEFNAFFGSLRALSQDQRQLGLLVADVHPDCNRINQWQQEGVPTNPVFSFFKEVFLSPFSTEETQTMLMDISRLMGRSFDPETLTLIHQDSGGHPFISRQLASLLCAKVVEQDGGQISEVNAQRYIKRPFAYSSILKDYFSQNIWADLKKRNFEAAMAVLKLLACNLDLDNGVTEQDLQARLNNLLTESQSLDALLWLEKVGLVLRVETKDNDYYRSHVPLLSRWLQMEMGEEEIRKWQIH
ncbi:MAG: HEAT repeat domain-containing protein [Stenomitos rutilans HA7619-LM2]|nr:HEAT repeat domain-containing protein [Stenomitos rutilans HA7619-LM2]